MQNLNWSQLLFNGGLIIVILCAMAQWVLNTPKLKQYFDKTDILSAWMVYVPFGRTALYFTNDQTHNTVKKYTLFLIPYILIILLLIFVWLENNTLSLLCAGFLLIYAIELSTKRDRFFREHDLHMINPVVFVFLILGAITLIVGFIMRFF